ncbi:DUF4097 and DUF4098 domain-containing protein YvlB [Paenibacillus taihuensis]|uniref:DUF4097 and DUF4098 domain-containing protein YvlB n=1 Tax=Paenibacillus taihuensis TaxID=1156355 RepID=A0A3D9SDK6_9BACL|nr:DUF4097 family beta strand repeat-containing protein [Paenibacillus taihuensis]REE92949.1 DUF4097 and DUF4098 domain-containing protein YvlB [Paenibacillus taihuensis]
MHEERTMVIRMIEEGKITAEQGLALLEALEEKQSQAAPTIEEEQVKPVSDSVSGQAAAWTSTFDAFGIEQMAFTAENGSIYFQTWDQPSSQVHVTLKSNKNLSVTELNEWLQRSISEKRTDEQYIWMIKHGDSDRDRELESEVVINIYVPDEQSFERFEATTTNGGIRIDTLMSEEASFTSTNGEIKLNGIHLETLKTTTMNGSIQLELGNAESAELIAMNGNVRVSGQFEELECRTTNGSIQLVDVMAEEIELRTKNGNIHSATSFEKLSCKTENGTIDVHNLSDGDSDLRAETINGSVVIVYDEGVAGVHGELQFGHGSARCTLNGQTYAYLQGENSKQRVEFHQGDEEQHHLTVSTVNGSIRIETTPEKNLLPS